MKYLLLLLIALNCFGNETITLTESNHIFFNKRFDDESVSNLQQKLLTMLSSDENKEVYIVLYTPGGSVSAGQRLFDFLVPYKKRVHTITIFAASMGYHLVQNAGKRYITPSGTLMSHRASIGGLDGEIGGNLDKFYGYIKESTEELEVIAAKRVGITLSYYQKQIADELWMRAKKSVADNHADSTVNILCDSTLAGTSVEQVNSLFFGSFNVEYSKCPLITAPLKIEPIRDNSFFVGKNPDELALKLKQSLINIRGNVGYER